MASSTVHTENIIIAFLRADHLANSHTKPNVQIQHMINNTNLNLLKYRGNAEFIDGYDVYV